MQSFALDALCDTAEQFCDKFCQHILRQTAITDTATNCDKEFDSNKLKLLSALISLAASDCTWCEHLVLSVSADFATKFVFRLYLTRGKRLTMRLTTDNYFVYFALV